MNFSVLMSVYSKENPDFLKQSIESVLNQTLMPSEIVIIKDGPIGEELDSIIEKIMSNNLGLFKIISLETNMGLGKALQIGVTHCSHPIIARMDTDDICLSHRFERQINYLKNNPSIDVVGSWVEEFTKGKFDTSNLIKRVPTNSELVNSKAKYRNPINHMSVVFRKQSVLDSGNYQPLLWNEDYYLWVRMISNGYKIVNIPEVLVLVRSGNEMYKRRGGIKYIKNELILQKKMLDIKFITFIDFLINILLRSSVRIMPNIYRGVIYQKILRSKK